MKEILQECWKNVIKNYFKEGLIAYERQLQVYFFLELRKALPNCVIWVEPMMFLTPKFERVNRPKLDGRIPDIVITLDKEIKVVIELKCKPWGTVKYEGDLQKLMYFEGLASEQKSIPLSWPPISSNWRKQSSPEGERYFEVDNRLLCVFGVIAKQNADALRQSINPGINNFLHLTHCIEDADI